MPSSTTPVSNDDWKEDSKALNAKAKEALAEAKKSANDSSQAAKNVESDTTSKGSEHQTDIAKAKSAIAKEKAKEASNAMTKADASDRAQDDRAGVLYTPPHYTMLAIGPWTIVQA